MAGVSVGGTEGQQLNGLTFHNGQWWSPAAYARQIATEPRNDVSATFRPTSGTEAQAYDAATNSWKTVPYNPPNNTSPTGYGNGSGGPVAYGGQPPVDLATIARSYDRNMATPLPPAPTYHAPAQTPYTDTTAEDALTFARAKDKVGLNTRASLDALRNEFYGRGLGGSNMEGAKIAQTINQGEGDLANTITGQAVQKTNRDAATADRNYQGALEGSRVGYEGDITTRGQNLSAADSRRQSILTLARMAPGGLIY